MVLRQAVTRNASRAFRPQSPLVPATRRGLAQPASGSFQYQTGEAAGVKYASRDLAGPTTSVALVSRAGTRFQTLPGLAEGLEKYAFRNTHRRSALRLQREAELFGATLFSHHSRETVMIGAKFFRDDLPYFLEVLNEVATETKYLDYEFKEQVLDMIHRTQHVQADSPKRRALASIHAVAFHRGLGEPLHPSPSSPLTKYLSHEAIGAYSTLAYRKPNIAIVANGAEHKDLEKYVGDFFADMRTEPAEGIPPMSEEQTKYYGGEERISHEHGNSMIIGFPGSSSMTGGFFKPEIAVLAALLGGQSAIKWATGFSLLARHAAEGRPGVEIETKSAIYSDAGLLYIAIDGTAPQVRAAAYDAVKTIRGVADGNLAAEDFQKAVAQARFKELEYGQSILAGLELTGAGLVQNGRPYQLDESAQAIGKVTQAQLTQAAKDLFQFKSSVATVGDLFQLPYAAELGLMV